VADEGRGEWPWGELKGVSTGEYALEISDPRLSRRRSYYRRIWAGGDTGRKVVRLPSGKRRDSREAGVWTISKKKVS